MNDIKAPVGCGVAVVVTLGSQVLAGHRQVADEGPKWQLPGGWIETGESPLATARREVLEETGLELRDLEFIGVTNNIFSPQNHSISLYFEAECIDEGRLIEAGDEKDVFWVWKNWADIQENLFLPLQLLKQTDYRPFLKDKRKTHVSF